MPAATLAASPRIQLLNSFAGGVTVTSSLRVLRPIVIALILFVGSTSLAQASVDVVPPLDAVVLHKKLLKRGVGKGVKVTEVDGTVVKGVLASIDADSFQITPHKSVQPITIPNARVHELSNDGLSHGAKIAIIVGICLVALGIGSAHV